MGVLHTAVNWLRVSTVFLRGLLEPLFQSALCCLAEQDERVRRTAYKLVRLPRDTDTITVYELMCVTETAL